MIRKYIDVVGRLNEWVGSIAGWLASALVLLICYDVGMKFFFDYSNAAIFELEWHVFALIFLLGAPYTLKNDRHVRVDVFYSNFSPKRKAWVNLLGVIFFLLPFCIIVIDKSWIYTRNSFLMGEGSPDPGGLPYRFVLKGAIMLAFALLILQGIALLFESLLTILKKDNAEQPS